MEPEEFEKVFANLGGERQKLIGRLNDIETELIDVRNKISHLTEVLNHLGPLARVAISGDISGLGITDAIRHILQTSAERMSPQDVRQQLSDRGYDLSSLTSPMASIYKILSRLADESEEAEREKENGRVYYRWKLDFDNFDPDDEFSPEEVSTEEVDFDGEKAAEQ